MGVWFSLSAGATVKRYYIEVSFNLFEWMFKKTFDSHRGIYCGYLGPFGIYVSDIKKVDEFIESIKFISSITERGIDEELNQRNWERTGPDGQPLN